MRRWILLISSKEAITTIGHCGDCPHWTNGVYSLLFRAKASGGHSKAREARDAQSLQKVTRFALIGVGPARPRPCKCPPPQIPVRVGGGARAPPPPHHHQQKPCYPSQNPFKKTSRRCHFVRDAPSVLLSCTLSRQIIGHFHASGTAVKPPNSIIMMLTLGGHIPHNNNPQTSLC